MSTDAAARIFLVTELVRSTGLKFASLELTLDGEQITKITIRYQGAATYEILDKLSKLFETRKISWATDIGPPPSDPAVSPWIAIHDPIVPGLDA